MILNAIVVFGVVIAAFTIALVFRPAAVADVVATVPVVGPLLVTDCYICDAPVMRGRAEEMPVVFGGSEGTDALTIQFCDECSRTMTLEDRLELLHGEAERRSDASE